MAANDILKEIEVHNMRKKMYEIEKEYHLKKMFRGPAGYKPINLDGMPKGNSDDSSLDKQIDTLEKLQHMIDLEIWAIESLEKQVKEIKNKISQLEGLDARVVYMRDYEGKTLKDIAKELRYEEGYIRNVSARNPRKLN